MLSCFQEVMKFIKDLKEGEFVTSQAQVRKKQIRLKRNKEPYLWMVLSDRSGRIDAKMWDRVQGPGQEIQEGDFVHYQGNVQTYNGSRQLIVEEVRKLDFEGDRQAVNVQDLIPCSQYDVEEMWQRLRSLLVEHTRRPCVLRLLERILDRYEQQGKDLPGGHRDSPRLLGRFSGARPVGFGRCFVFRGQVSRSGPGPVNRRFRSARYW